MSVTLVSPLLKSELSIEEDIFKRRSVRDFTDDPIDLQVISQILGATQGRIGSKRIVPSVEATYPLEI